MIKLARILKTSKTAVFNPVYPHYYRYTPRYDYVHYVTESGLPISKIVNQGEVVVKTHDFVSWVKSALLWLIILVVILLMGANVDIKSL